MDPYSDKIRRRLIEKITIKKIMEIIKDNNQNQEEQKLNVINLINKDNYETRTSIRQKHYINTLLKKGPSKRIKQHLKYHLDY
jgi:hypothetical protein